MQSNSSSDFTGHIGEDTYPRKAMNNKVNLDNEFNTLDEPIIDTIVLFDLLISMLMFF